MLGRHRETESRISVAADRCRGASRPAPAAGPNSLLPGAVFPDTAPEIPCYFANALTPAASRNAQFLGLCGISSRVFPRVRVFFPVIEQCKAGDESSPHCQHHHSFSQNQVFPVSSGSRPVKGLVSNGAKSPLMGSSAISSTSRPVVSVALHIFPDFVHRLVAETTFI